MEVEQSPIEIVFQGGRHHSVQILATPVFIETQTPINSGSYQWLRLADGEYLPIKGATTRCYSPTADDLYTNIRLCYTTVDGLETVVNVPTDFFVMDPFVQTTVEQYVNQGRSEGITFEVTMVGDEHGDATWLLHLQEGQAHLIEEEETQATFSKSTVVVLSPTNPSVFRLGDYYMATDSLRSRDVIALTYRALMDQL
eukprot:TRINITY_DN8927_c0_g1_i1.p1 TRINITY_DN8927_c0_g1~~TRINITY_DN8927_c0_g1_i1.p1  ORF type:complete len:198 (+),score=41.28 TRINITY_DN8927_c0_g1_i1:151-744(+)